MGKEKTISSNSLIQEFKYEDGSILKVNVVNNKKEGPYKKYDWSGKLEEEGVYKNDKLDGMSKKYNGNGGLEEVVTYKNGKFELHP